MYWRRAGFGKQATQPALKFEAKAAALGLGSSKRNRGDFDGFLPPSFCPCNRCN
jgi:hypothetical protein